MNFTQTLAGTFSAAAQLCTVYSDFRIKRKLQSQKEFVTCLCVCSCVCVCSERRDGLYSRQGALGLENTWLGQPPTGNRLVKHIHIFLECWGGGSSPLRCMLLKIKGRILSVINSCSLQSPASLTLSNRIFPCLGVYLDKEMQRCECSLHCLALTIMQKTLFLQVGIMRQ